MLPKYNDHSLQEYNDPSPSMFIDERFRIISTLGKGTYGTVVLAEEKETKKRCAIKIIKKRDLMLSNLGFKQVFNEKSILQTAQFPFIVDFYGSFKSNSNLFLTLEFVQGGDLFTHLKKMNCFSEDVVKFFAIQIVLAFEYLHQLDIIYRDLKPENILLDQHGYCKLADFGMSKQLNNKRTYTICGTWEYMAPEIIKNQGYGTSIDWWMFGILVYDLCSGRTPFKAASLNKLQQTILKGKYRMCRKFSAPLKNLIRQLLQTDRRRRIGCHGGDAREIKAHAWFNDINQQAILQRRITSPFLPTIKDCDDMNNFDFHEETTIFESSEIESENVLILFKSILL
ncbi:cAMP-dependent protein kinase catalytic subunit alpha [Trichinella pseudospiralis]|uniref:cAMP-dependent protein kinase n=1 Tax=Trichinella pseudospiralis TaxID=6337 RepID=A0A0V1ELU6_TRIPS|nr:cAMP-dependent protein kinase catalytic subunit alpha [Trichinella pseudospiralis]KRZ35112.1 cAMP-dependent protein kinase catalytic subunit alpha [Trichinella pseudospiralis]KRZ44131.1 cAMP-dependent protein kinase catalytic subunit alpha [Trichinella pseudospiralis]